MSKIEAIYRGYLIKQEFAESVDGFIAYGTIIPEDPGIPATIFAIKPFGPFKTLQEASDSLLYSAHSRIDELLESK